MTQMMTTEGRNGLTSGYPDAQHTAVGIGGLVLLVRPREYAAHCAGHSAPSVEESVAAANCEQLGVQGVHADVDVAVPDPPPVRVEPAQPLRVGAQLVPQLPHDGVPDVAVEPDSDIWRAV